MNKRIRIFVDMDCCLAKWENNSADFSVEGFFENLEAQQNLVNALNSIIDDVYIISHYVDTKAIIEKKFG